MTFPQGRRQAGRLEAYPLGYVEGVHATENAAGNAFSAISNKKASIPRPGTEA